VCGVCVCVCVCVCVDSQRGASGKLVPDAYGLCVCVCVCVCDSQRGASGKLVPDAYGLVGLRGRQSARPNHASLLLKKKSDLKRSRKSTLMGK
jgi:hypothetical protein